METTGLDKLATEVMIANVKAINNEIAGLENKIEILKEKRNRITVTTLDMVDKYFRITSSSSCHITYIHVREMTPSSQGAFLVGEVFNILDSKGKISIRYSEDDRICYDINPPDEGWIFREISKEVFRSEINDAINKLNQIIKRVLAIRLTLP